MRPMSDTVDQIKSRLDIVDVVSGYLKLQKAGANWKARCPFHSEKTPSFHISPERQSWHCFGCNKGGDMFSFVQQIENIEFPDALRTLAAKAGVQVPERSPSDRAARGQRQKLALVTELAAKFFERQLWEGTNGAKALAYLHGRGMTDDTVRVWRLGWAPNDWRALTTFLSGQGIANAEMVAAGMAAEKNGRLYDRFRSRIMFPIADGSGTIVGFTGRVFGVEQAVDGEPLAKYVNTPQTPLYDKSRVIYGLDKAKTDIRARDACLLVEGNMDAILSWQAGATHTVATSGTALTPHQLRALGRFTTNLDFCFDTDQAGDTATRRGIGLALAQDFTVRVVPMNDPGCKDPADYVAKHGAKWNEVSAQAVPVLQYYYERASQGFDPSSPKSKRAAIQLLGPLIRRMASRVEQSHWIGQLAVLLRTDQASVQADVAAVKDDIAAAERGADEPVAETVTTPETPLDSLNEELLALLAIVPDLAASAAEVADAADPRVGAFLREPALLTEPADDAQRHILDAAHLRADGWYAGYSPGQLASQCALLVAKLRERDLRVRRARLEPLIREAEQRKDQDTVTALLTEFQQFTTELNRIQNLQTPTTA